MRTLSPIGFCVLLATLGVALRVVLVDYVFFALREVPSHDFSQGLAFFATSMHSMRLSGDLAWWYPGSFTGYAQYFQGFFSPLAPTYGHIVFIAWAHLVAILSGLGVHVPEYFQYLVVNHLVLPFLALLAFAWFCSLVLRRRPSIAIVVLTYVLSGIGLWNSAWFFFQEAFSFFFLLGTLIALLQRPGPARLLIFLAAVLVQLASLNYWTIYNLFFFVIAMGAYALTHRNQVVRLVVRVRGMAADRRAALFVAGAFGLTALAWIAVIASAMLEQSGSYFRTVYSAQDAVARIVELRRYTIELFNPLLDRALQKYFLINAMHNARYIGVALLPLIAIGVIAGTGRRVRWLLLTATVVLAVCLGVPFAVKAWIAVPFMDRILHLLYFYSHYWQILLVLLAGVGLDMVLRPATNATRRVAFWVLGLCIAVAAGVMAWHAVLSHTFHPGDVNLQANLHAALVLGLAGVILLRAFLRPREVRFAVGAVLLVTLVDLSLYFDAASRADIAFTAKRGWAGATPSAEQRAALARPWGAPRPELGFAAGTELSMPIQNEFWPGNYFMTPRALPRPADGSVATALWNHARSSLPLLFFDGAIAAPGPWPAFSAADVPAMDRKLLVAVAPGAPGTGSRSVPVAEGFNFRWKQWLYNQFRFEVTAPTSGWLMVRQLHDPAWRVEVGGREVRPLSANALSMAIPLEKGIHDIRFEYRPLSRRLYWPAAFLLEAVVAVFLTLAWTGRASRYSASRARPRGAAS